MFCRPADPMAVADAQEAISESIMKLFEELPVAPAGIKQMEIEAAARCGFSGVLNFHKEFIQSQCGRRDPAEDQEGNFLLR